MRRLVSAVSVGLLLLLVSASVLALGMGRVRTSSLLGDPLDFTVALLAQPGDPVVAECIRADVYSGDSRIPDELVRISINRARDGSADSLRVVTATRIDEPLARVDLQLQCGTLIRRSYVVFIDPPSIDLARSGNRIASGDALIGPPTGSRAAEPATASAPRPAPRRAASSRGSRDPAARRSSGSGTSRTARAPRASSATAAPRSRDTVVARAQPEAAGSSLKLESTPTVQPRTAPAVGSTSPLPARTAANPAAVAASAAPGTTAPGALIAGPAASDGALAAGPSASAAVSGLLGEIAARAEADALLVSAEKLRALDENLGRLRNDNAALQRTTAELQARLREAEEDRSSNTLIYGLVAALLLLLVAVAALLARQAALRREAEWLKVAAAEEPHADEHVGGVRSIVRPSSAAGSRFGAEAAAAAAARLSEAATTPGPRSALNGAATRSAAPAVVEPAVAATAATAAAVAAQQSPSITEGPFERTAIHDARHQVSVDELIDLEQQADFFEVLGQDDSAIDLLMGQLQGPGGASPLPYLKLLEIHRRRGERAAYDRIRERFDRRFNAFAPEWEAHSGHDRALQDYPQVIEQLQRSWASSPAQAMNTLTDLLFKRNETNETFDLPAYGELLFLYSVARELAESEFSADGVDLLLPLDGGPSDGSPGDDTGGLSIVNPERPTQPRPSEDFADLPFFEPELEPDPGHGAGAAEPAWRSTGTGSLPDLDLDLDLRDEPAEPKGPLSKN